MFIFESIDKLITEHSSDAIFCQWLAFAKDQFADLERKVANLQIQVGRVEAQLERERLDHKQARDELLRLKDELQRLKDKHAEDIRIHRGIEFRRGKRTGDKWQPFCPKCHMPAMANEDFNAGCTAQCGWYCDVSQQELVRILAQL
ncbi:MAG: hypothetical protein ACLQAH_18225 [Limisphaerales bacterium]